MSQIFDKTTKALGSAINFRQLRQNLVSSNIANAETPGYKAKRLRFEEALTRAIDLSGKTSMLTSDPNHIANGPGRISNVRTNIFDDPDINLTNDGNTVDMEKEMAILKENSLIYKAAVQLINKKLGALKYTVTEGGR